MTAAWVMYVLAVGALLAIGAEGLASAFRQMGRSTRFAHAGALAAILVLAVLAPKPAAVEIPVAMDTGVVTARATNTAPELTLLDRARGTRAAISDEVLALTDALQRRVTPAAARIALVGWIGVSAVLLLLFALVNRRFANARSGWPSRSLHGTTVRVAPGLGPAVLGFLRAEIVVPQSLLERSDEDQRLILAHEREHLRTRDHLLLGGAWLCAIAFPWHPAVWFLASRIRLAIELDCDARVLRGGASPRSYGALLLDMAARQSAARIGALALADGPSHLERRIQAMKATRGRHAAVRGLLLGAVGCLLVLVACEAKVPTAAEVASMDVGTLEKKAAQLDLLDGKIAKADYFVNGEAVSADSARSIVAAKIGSVEVVKSQFASGRDTIFITTADLMRGARIRTDDLVPLPFVSGLSRDAVLMIDGVVQQPGIKSRLDSKDVVSVSVLKPGQDPKYPNGLIAIETRRANRPDAERRPAGAETRTDTPGATSARLYPTPVRDGERTRFANSRDSSGAPVLVTTFDGRKPFAITIDGARATMSELEALEEADIKSMMMYAHDARAMSSDPVAANGLLKVITKARAKQ
jgi:beta-lactamase regulating signal transducer with metallopeptidase domain